MKKMLVVLLALALVFSLAACGTKDAANTTTDETTNDQTTGERTTFTVGFDAEFPPYGYVDESGNYVGFDLDLAAEVAARNGWELVLQPIAWDSKDAELNAGTIDCIWNGFTMNGREDLYTWSDAYVDNTQVFVVKADSGIAAQADLAGKIVAVQTESSAQSALESEDLADLTASFANLDVVADYNTAFLNLEAGAVDAVAMDLPVANYQLEQREEGLFVIMEEPISSEQYGIGFKLGNEALRDQVQATLDEMMADGTFAQIAEKWGQQDIVIVK